MATDRLVTRREAARLCGCSYDAIRRRESAGDYPHATKVDGSWLIPVSDLVVAGHLATVAPSDDACSAEPRGDLAVLEAKLAMLEAEIAHLRQLTILLARTPVVQ